MNFIWLEHAKCSFVMVIATFFFFVFFILFYFSFACQRNNTIHILLEWQMTLYSGFIFGEIATDDIECDSVPFFGKGGMEEDGAG